jgi:hypothetical protein
MESEATPMSTEDIAAGVIAESDGATESVAPEISIESAPEVSTQVAPEPVKLSPAEEFLLEQGHKIKKDDGRDNWLPAKTLPGMLARYLEKHGASWATERSTLEKERDEYKQSKADMEEFARDFRGDERAFIEKLASFDPRYKTFLTPAQKVELAENADDPEPPLILDKGAEEYTKSLKELRAWDRRQAKREAVAETKAMVEPYAERARKEEFERAGRESFQKQVTAAASWPMFGALPTDGSLTEFQTEVLGVLKADTGKKMSLREAYLEVYAKKIAPDRNTMREELMKELNSAPKSTSVTKAGVESTRPVKRTTEDIAREIVGKMS